MVEVKSVIFNRGKAGSALFELVLAVLIFGMAALALSQALYQVGLLAIETKQASQIQSKAHSLLFEYGFGLELVEGVLNIPSENDEIRYQVVIEPVEIQNMEGVVLPAIYRIAVDVDWEENGEEQHYTAETLRYALLYR